MVGRTPRVWRRVRRLANVLGACVVFLWIATTLLMRDSSVSDTLSGSGVGVVNLSDVGLTVIQENPLHIYTVPPKFEKYLVPPIPPYQANSSSLNDTIQRVLTVKDIADAMAFGNAAQTIHNEAIFGPVDNATIVVVVQVHARAEYLKHLVVSLAAAKDIEKALVIFSHDLYDAEINDVVSRIDFCRYAQIFFPLAIQTHPDHFPGDDPRDCPPDMKRAAAEKLGCQNAKWPDKFGHYRQAKLSQIKHHWWWKAWYLFEGGFKALDGFKGDIIFLEEDHWVVEDFIPSPYYATVPVYRLLKKEGRSWCPECSFISLGNYLKKQDRAGNQVEISQWISSKHNMGMAFGREAWNVVKSCARQFCLFDDYNWDWSLMYIGMTCTKPKLMTLNLKSSRVFHIGECGIHHKKKSCDVLPVLNKVHAQIRTYGELYPETLSFRRATYKLKAPKGNGGWGDYRDRALCLNFTSMSFLQAS